MTVAYLILGFLAGVAVTTIYFCLHILSDPHLEETLSENIKNRP
jgi:hypothetical protein